MPDQLTRTIIGDATTYDLSQLGRFGVILADPPWPYQPWSKHKHGAATAHYRTLSIEDIAAENCILFLWGTWPKLPEAVKVMVAWGFNHVTGLPWIKLNKTNGGIYYGMGFWVRGCSEYVLIGRRGNVSPPRLKGFLGLLSPNLQHSRKPDSIHDLAESLPGPYIELFARRTRLGWTSFGNEIAEASQSALFTSTPGERNA